MPEHGTGQPKDGRPGVEPAPLRLVLGSQALVSTIDTLRRRIEGFGAQQEIPASTDFPVEA